MKSRSSTIGTPLFLALILVSAVSLSARLYKDHGMSQKVEASTTHAEMVTSQLR